jgi:hypothetical protein
VHKAAWNCIHIFRARLTTVRRDLPIHASQAGPFMKLPDDDDPPSGPTRMRGYRCVTLALSP